MKQLTARKIALADRNTLARWCIELAHSLRARRPIEWRDPEYVQYRAISAIGELKYGYSFSEATYEARNDNPREDAKPGESYDLTGG